MNKMVSSRNTLKKRAFPIGETKMMQMKKLLLLGSLMILIAGSCEKEDKYSGIVYKNYLSYEITRAEQVLSISYEGDREGEYQPGSKQVYQDAIDLAQVVYDNESASQKEVDESYAGLLHADTNFYNAMVPFRSLMQPIIVYAEFIHNNTSEGSQEGEVLPGSKEELQSAINDAKNVVANPDLTQAELNVAMQTLGTAIFNFNTSINGKASIIVNNFSFEQPGIETNGFEDVPGWSTFGTVEEWAPNPGLILNDSTTDGDFAARIGTYTTGIFQVLPELVNPFSNYVVKADASLMSNGLDWENKRYPVVVRTRLITFNQNPGDYKFITVLGESIDTLGLFPASFKEIELEVDIDAATNTAGRKMGVDFILRHTFDSENPIWAESYMSIDNIRLTREN